MNETPTVLELMEPASPEALVPDYGLWPWFLAALVGIVLLTAVLLLIRKWRKPTTESPAALREAAFRDALAALNDISAAPARATAVQASLILRKYLATAAADPALYETHEEFISRQDSLQALHSDARTAAETGFSRLALLKYAPDIPDEEPAAIRDESRTLLKTLHHGFAA